MKLEQRLVTDFELKADAQEGTISGYGAIFNNVDDHGDVIQEGAFADSLEAWQRKGKWPKMLLQHGSMFGGSADDLVPVGQWTSMEENERGLKVRGRLFALTTERGQYLYENLKAGELDGLSIGYKVTDSIPGKRPGEPSRTLTAIDLWEVSLVTFPANDRARITAVKGMTAEQWRDLETILRDEGLSHRSAVTALSGFRKWLQRDVAAPISAPRDEVPPEAADVLKSLARLTDGTWSDVFRR